MVPQERRIVLPYDQAEHLILDADILLCRRTNMAGIPIGRASRSRYTHAAMAGWTNGESAYRTLLFFETVQWVGGREGPLATYVQQWPGVVDVYRVADTTTMARYDAAKREVVTDTYVLNRRLAVKTMRQITIPDQYGWMNLLLTGLVHLPLLRWFYQQPFDDLLTSTRPPYCSQAVSYAIQKAFTDVVRHTPHMYTNPGDLERSPLLSYVFTLGASTTPIDVRC